MVISGKVREKVPAPHVVEAIGEVNRSRDEGLPRSVELRLRRLFVLL
ncbi:hypothetical protein NOCARDAX2BIS_220140 [Nocardioides sp. AX2bis]|nr:hypothetical protein NOCARDAX2BIS_220140 [Nocardioides sp. AX2bis]